MIRLFFFLFIPLFGLQACQSESSKKSDTDQSEMVEPDKDIRYAWVNDLRIRENPDKSATVVAKLQEGDKVEYLGEMSENKEDITLRGERYVEPWLKVKTEDAKVGWVFGGGLRKEVQLSQEEQRRQKEKEEIQKEAIFTIRPGHRIGMLGRSSCLKDLVNACGKNNVYKNRTHVGEGNFVEAHIAFEGGLNEFAVSWKADSCEPQTVYIYDNNGIDKPGPDWKLKNGITFGTSLKELERLNGGPLEFSGFEWDYAGQILDYKGGKLQRAMEGITLHIEPLDDNYDDALAGDRIWSSKSPEARASEFVVSTIIANF